MDEDRKDTARVWELGRSMFFGLDHLFRKDDSSLDAHCTERSSPLIFIWRILARLLYSSNQLVATSSGPRLAGSREPLAKSNIYPGVPLSHGSCDATRARRKLMENRLSGGIYKTGLVPGRVSSFLPSFPSPPSSPRSPQPRKVQERVLAQRGWGLGLHGYA